MGKSNKDILKDIKPKEVIEQLNKAYADELVAFFQYLSIVYLANGKKSFKFAEQVKEIAYEELEHADEIAERISQLGGTVLTDITVLNEKATCKYNNSFPKEDTDLEAMAKMILEAEHCAIGVYDDLLKLTKDKDLLTYQVVLHIIAEEAEHETLIKQFLGK